MKTTYLQIDNGKYEKGKRPDSFEFKLTDDLSDVIEPGNLPSDFVSGSVSLALQTDDGTEAPAKSYSLRKYQMDALTTIKKKFDLKGDVDVSVKRSKEGKQYLTYTVYKTQRVKK
jgi:hypothetical protein